MRTERRLNFCPRNKILHKLLSDAVYEAFYSLFDDGVHRDIVVHHVTDLAKGALQIEYEVRREDGIVSFHRTVLT